MPRLDAGDAGGDEEFEILVDANWFKRTFRDMKDQSMGRQLVVGGTAGLASGYICGKIGKAAAAAMGGSLLVMQIAAHKGYITVNWGKLDKSMKKAKKRLQDGASRSRVRDALEDLEEFVKNNVFIAGGFAGGFFIGLAC